MGIYDPAKRVYRKAQSKFTAKGSADILGIFHGYMICIEVKRKGNKPTEDQMNWLEEMAGLGALCAVVYSLEQAISAMDHFQQIVNADDVQSDKPRSELS